MLLSRAIDPIDRPGTSGTRPASPLRAGFSVVELLVVIGIIGVLLAIMLPVLSRARAAERRLTCLNNLKNIGQAFHAYAIDNRNCLPAPDGPWEQSLWPYLENARVFYCPADNEIYPGVGSSYDWRDTGNPATSLFGRSLDNVKPNLVIAFDSLPGWHEKDRISVITLDAAAVSMDQEEYFRNLDQPVGR